MTQTTASKPAKKSGSGWYSQLFFNRRRPHLRALPKDWIRPEDEDAYQKLIHDDGFVSPKYYDEADLSQYPLIVHDADDLAEYLLPTYFQYSQLSKYYQDRFYFYQWVFVIGAFLTTVLGALATLLSVQATSAVQVASTAQVSAAAQAAAAAQVSATIPWQQITSLLTAAVGALTAFFTALSNRGEPQKRWGKTRRLTEEMRMLYFTYLSHLPPYDTPDRVQIMRGNVIDIRVKEQQNV